MTNFVKEFFKSRKEKAALKKLFKEDSDRYLPLERKVIEKIEKLPEELRKWGRSKQEEWKQIYVGTQVTGLKLSDASPRLHQLCDAMTQWLASEIPTSPPPQRTRGTTPLQPLQKQNQTQTQDTPPQTPVEPKPLDLTAVKGLVGRVKRIADWIQLVPLDVPALVSGPLQRGEEQVQLGEKAQDLEGTAQALQGVLDQADALFAFGQRWGELRRRETQAEASPPQDAPLLLGEVVRSWVLERNRLGGRWRGLTKIGDLDSCTQELETAAARAFDTRAMLMQGLQTLRQEMQPHEERLKELQSTKLLNLQAPTQIQQSVRNALLQAGDADALQKVRQMLASLGQQLDIAAKGLEGPRGKALEEFQKLRLKVQVMIEQARTFRGAQVKPSPVYEAIQAVVDQLNEADRLRSEARTTEELVQARQPLATALKGKLLEDVKKLSEQQKKLAGRDLKALPKYQKLMEELRQLRAQIAELPGADGKLKELDLLMAQNRVLPNGAPDGGFDAAVTRISEKKPDSLLKEAEKASRDFTTKSLPPQALGPLREAREAITAFEKCHTPYESALRRQALAQAAGSDDPAGKLGAFLVAIKTDIQIQQDFLKGLQTLAQTIEDDLKAVVIAGVLASDPNLLTIQQRLGEARGMMKDWRLADAQDSLDLLRELTTQLQLACEQANNQWQLDATFFKTIAEPLDQLAEGLGNVGAGARGLRDDIGKLVQRKPGEMDIRDVAERAGKHRLRWPDLQTLCKNQGVTDPGKLQGMSKVHARLEAEWNALTLQFHEALDKLAEILVKAGVKGGVDSLSLKGDLLQLTAAWRSAIAQLKLKPEQRGAETLLEAHQPWKQKLLRLIETIPKDPKNLKDPLLKETIRSGLDREAQAQWRRTHQAALNLLREIRTDMQYQADSEKPSQLILTFDHIEVGKLLGDAYDEGIASADKAKVWKDRAETMTKWLGERRKEIREQKIQVKSDALEWKHLLREKLGDRQSVKFRGLFDDMSKRLDDAISMLETDDVALVKAAEMQITEIRLMLKDAKGRGNKAAVTLAQLDKRHADLSHLLGDGYHVQKRLPQTYARIKPLLDNTWNEVKRMPPEEGMRKLEALQAPILQARKTAKELTVRYEAFKLQREQIEDLHGKLKDHTGTTLAKGRTKAYNERLTARLNEAHTLARQEGQLEEGFKALQLIEHEIQSLLDQPPLQARAQLMKMDAEEAEGQRELRDLARIWNTTQEYWEKKQLPQVKKAVEKREEALREYLSLEAAVLNIGKTLTPYLDVVSAVPHKRGLSNGAPDMPTARGAFSQAHLRLGQLQRVAQRLLTGQSSTNVDLVSDFSKLREEWAQRTERLSKEMAQLALELRGLAPQAMTDEGAKDDEQRKPFFLTDEQKTTLEQSVQTIEKGLQTLSTRFPANAFDAPLATLANAKLDAATRLKAREEALRMVNRLKADLVDNPLFQGLFQGASRGFLSRDPRPVIGLLRSSLKKIELATLVGI